MPLGFLAEFTNVIKMTSTSILKVDELRRKMIWFNTSNDKKTDRTGLCPVLIENVFPFFYPYQSHTSEICLLNKKALLRQRHIHLFLFF